MGTWNGVETWRGEPVDGIVCMRLDEGPPGAPSTEQWCSSCGAGVWLAASSLAVVLRYPETPLLCGPCAVRRVEEAR